MEKRQQEFSIWYFVAALILILIIQNFLQSPHVESLNYSQFKALVKKGLVADLVIGEATIRGNLKSEALPEIFPPEKLKELGQDPKDAKKAYPFVTVKVSDPDLTAELEEAGISFRGEVSAN